MLLARRDVREDFFVKKCQRPRVDERDHLRKEQLQELDEEGREEFLEETVVVNVPGGHRY